MVTAIFALGLSLALDLSRSRRRSFPPSHPCQRWPSYADTADPPPMRDRDTEGPRKRSAQNDMAIDALLKKRSAQHDTRKPPRRTYCKRSALRTTRATFLLMCNYSTRAFCREPTVVGGSAALGSGVPGSWYIVGVPVAALTPGNNYVELYRVHQYTSMVYVSVMTN